MSFIVQPAFMRAVLAASAYLCALAGAQAERILTTTTSPREEARVGVGLQWNFGASQPELTLAARWTRTQTDSNVVGVKFDVALPVLNGWRPTLRLMGLAGDRDIQGEFGFGYRFATSKVLLGLGAQAPYVNGGMNYEFGDSVAAYGGVNTFGRLVAPRQTTTVGSPPI